MPALLPTFAPLAGNIDLSRFEVSRPAFVATRTNPALTGEERDCLKEFAECVRPFPASFLISQGRSVFARTAAGSSWQEKGILGVKAKAIQAIEIKGGEYCLSFPKPDQSYSDARIPHFSFNERLELKVVFGRPKALNSMLQENAEMEFDSQEALFKVGVGFMPLLAGSFGSGTSAETDCFDENTGKRKTGGVFLSHDPETIYLGEIIGFIWHRENWEDVKVLPPNANLGDSSLNLRSFVNNFIGHYEGVGRTQFLAIVEAGIARHSSTGTNFCVSRQSGKKFQTDNDTCISLYSLPANLRGPQLLRDTASTMVKMAEFLTLCAHSTDFRQLLTGSCPLQPFQPYLHGFFCEQVDPSEIGRTADRLRIRYLRFIDERQRKFDNLTSQWVESQIENDESQRRNLEAKCNFIFSPFFVDCCLELYTLISRSKLEQRGLFLPKISTTIFTDNLVAGVDALRSEYLKFFIGN